MEVVHIIKCIRISATKMAVIVQRSLKLHDEGMCGNYQIYFCSKCSSRCNMLIHCSEVFTEITVEQFSRS